MPPSKPPGWPWPDVSHGTPVAGEVPADDGPVEAGCVQGRAIWGVSHPGQAAPMSASHSAHLERCGIPDEDGAVLCRARERRAVGRPGEVDQALREGGRDRGAGTRPNVDPLGSTVGVCDDDPRAVRAECRDEWLVFGGRPDLPSRAHLPCHHGPLTQVLGKDESAVLRSAQHSEVDVSNSGPSGLRGSGRFGFGLRARGVDL
jgi:hypothetical protein